MKIACQKTPSFKIKQCLRWLGAEHLTRYEPVSLIIKQKLIAARRNNDDDLASLLSQLKAFFKNRLPHTCKVDGCGLAIGSDAIKCKMHNLMTSNRTTRKFLTVAAMIIAMLSPAFISARPIKLAWDPSTTGGITNYVLTVFDGGRTNRVNVGTNLTASLDFTNGTYSVFVTAQKNGLESDPSNTVLFEVPATPKHLRTLVLQADATLSGTNWLDMGFFRIRIEP